ncbi:MAG: VOC family protein [Flavisolibacter sp.]
MRTFSIGITMMVIGTIIGYHYHTINKSSTTQIENIKRVTGIGGIFFKSKDPKASKEWYSKHLGFTVADDGSVLFETKNPATGETGYTVWSPFKETTDYFKPSEKEFMFNFRVENLKALLEELKKEGVQVVGEMEEYSYGKFGWILDSEGNKIELWEPLGSEFNQLYKGKTIY